MIIRRDEFLERGTQGTFLKRLKLVRRQIERGGGAFFRLEDHEVAVIPLTGKVDVKAEGEWGKRKWLDVGGRESVFDELPTIVMLPPCQLVLNAHEPVDVLIASVSGRKKTKALPRLIRPEDLEVVFVGKDSYKRQVRSMQQDDYVLKCGETIHSGPGTWSSWPKHREVGNTERVEEVKFVLLKRVIGWGEDFVEPWTVVVQDGMMHGEEIHEVHKISSGDVIIQPVGRHPIVGSPFTNVYYFWILTGPDELGGLPKKYGKFAGESDYV